jgi:WD40-like Beta Propeller Repeat
LEEAIFLIDRDGSNERKIAAGRWPDWSPDGKKIVFSLGAIEIALRIVERQSIKPRTDVRHPGEISRNECNSLIEPNSINLIELQRIKGSSRLRIRSIPAC